MPCLEQLTVRNTGELVNSMKPYENKTTLTFPCFPSFPAKLIGFGSLLCLSVGSPFVSGIFCETLQDFTGAKTSAIQGEIAKAAQHTRAEKLPQRT